MPIEDVKRAKDARPRVYVPRVLDDVKKSRVKQEFKKECDINTLRRRMEAGIDPPRWMTSKTPRYEDVSAMPVSFAEAFKVMERGKAAFESLPLEMRRELDHNPRNLDRAPRELFEKYGLVRKPKQGAPESGSAASDAPAGQGASGGVQSPGKGAPAPKKGGSTPPVSSEGEK